MATSGKARSRCCTPQCGVLALFFTLTTIVSLVLLVSLIFILRWRFWTPSRGGVVHTLEFGAVAATTCLVLPVLWAIRACVARNSRNRDCGGSRPVQAACVAVFGVALVCVIGIFFTVLIFPLHSVTVSRSIPDSTSMVVPDTGGSASGGSASGGSASGGGTTTRRKRIAVIGGGPSGCVAALGMNYQQDKYEFVLYEKEGQLGGECATWGSAGGAVWAPSSRRPAEQHEQHEQHGNKLLACTPGPVWQAKQCFWRLARRASAIGQQHGAFCF